MMMMMMMMDNFDHYLTWASPQVKIEQKSNKFAHTTGILQYNNKQI